jgi:competence protein ComEC
VAGLATTPYAAFHFHRVTPYGVLANLAAMPVVSALVMPAGILGLVAMPFGFDGVFWRLMDVGIQWMIVVTQWVAALPGAIGRMPAFGIGPLISASIGIIVLGLLRTPLRFAGAGVLALSIAWALLVKQPDVLIAGDGHSVAVRGRDGRLHVMRSAKDAFLLKEWLAGDADARLATDASLSDGVSCDSDGCVTPLADGAFIALTLQPDGFIDDCLRAAVIVTTRQPPSDCRALVINRDQLMRNGAMTLQRTANGFSIDAIRPRGVDRPWAPAIADDTETEVASKRVTPARPVDATPVETDIQPED